jgi:hypothetical protein
MALPPWFDRHPLDPPIHLRPFLPMGREIFPLDIPRAGMMHDASLDACRRRILPSPDPVGSYWKPNR